MKKIEDDRSTIASEIICGLTVLCGGLGGVTRDKVIKSRQRFVIKYKRIFK